MKKKILIVFLAITAALCCAAGFTACGDGNENHTHTYDQQTASADYLKSPATCTQKAVYYKSCVCGEKGTETFEYGEATGHIFKERKPSEKYLKSEADCTHKAVYYFSCSQCGEKGTETFEYGEVNTEIHTYDRQVATENYLKSEADCTHSAVYFKSCACGEKGTDTFEHGEPNGHNFTNQTATAQYLKSQADCTHKAVYYKSCSVCGERGTDTFEHGEANGHSFTNQTATAQYLKSQADCTHKAVYYFSCSKCGEKGTETFEYGNYTHSYMYGVCTICGNRLPTNGLKYTLSSDKTYYSVTDIGSADSENIVIAPEYDGLPVKRIGTRAFENNLKIKSVFFPDSITEIAEYAFYRCNKITDITIPDSVTKIGTSAFGECSIDSVSFGSGLTNISPAIFGYFISGIRTVTVSEDNVRYRSVDNCVIDTQTKTLVIGSHESIIPDDGSVTSIGSYAFRSSTIFTLTVPDGITEIGTSAFDGCSNLYQLTLSNNLLKIGESAFHNCEDLESITLPDSLTEISAYAFAECDKIQTVTIPDKVTKINACTFEKCIQLNSVTMGSGVKYIGLAAFADCTNLKSIELGSGVSVIEQRAFQKCSSLETVVLPENASFINTAFPECPKLKYTEYGNGLYLGSKTNPYLLLVKAKDTSITSCTVHENTKIICGSAFYNCKELTDITIPESVTAVGVAFQFCDKLKYTEYGNALYLGNEANPYHILVKAKDTSITSCTVNEKTKVISSKAFYNCAKLTAVEIPASVTYVCESAFENCTRLTDVSIKGNQISIGNNAYYNCAGITEIKFGGTKEQWITNENIILGIGITNYSVICTDGTIVKQ